MASENFSRIFKAYDVRGIYPTQIDEEVAYKVGQAFAATRKPSKLVVGQDVRTSGEILKKKLVEGLLKAGVDVTDIGIITTDQLYFTVGKYGFDGGISVTASHNPSEYNGFKFAEFGGAPISSESLIAIRDYAMSGPEVVAKTCGKQESKQIFDDYIEHVLTFINPVGIKPLQIVANANFGAVGHSVDKLAEKLSLKLKRLNWQQDGTFPKGPPNPLLPENRAETCEMIKNVSPDLGVSWDADADRVFFFDGKGQFIPSCYIIALIAVEFIKRFPKAKIVHDFTLRWVIDDAVEKAGGQSIINRVGHTFIKARMRQEGAPFAAESSGHYYFADNFSADNGLVPFLMIIEMLSKSGKSLGELVEPLRKKYYISDEINFKVANPDAAIDVLEKEFGPQGKVEKIDGLAVTTTAWRFNARPSNTEPLLRLNAETKSQAELDALVGKIKKIIT